MSSLCAFYGASFKIPTREIVKRQWALTTFQELLFRKVSKTKEKYIYIYILQCIYCELVRIKILTRSESDYKLRTPLKSLPVSKLYKNLIIKKK